jgi:hypothetical protein
MLVGDRSFLNFAVAYAGRAHANPFTSAFDQGMNGLEIQIPTTLCDVVGMTDTVPKLRPTTAEFANF